MNALRLLGFSDYSEYLRSDRWARRREKYRQTHPEECQICYSTRQCELHHISYRHLGNEPDIDLAWLCHEHHEEITRANQRFDAAGRELATVRMVEYLVQLGISRDEAEAMPKRIAADTIGFFMRGG